MKAQWLVTHREDGINLTYRNLKDGTILDCGTVCETHNVHDFIEFAKCEGALDGDGFFLNGSLLCLIYLGDSHGKQSDIRN